MPDPDRINISVGIVELPAEQTIFRSEKCWH